MTFAAQHAIDNSSKHLYLLAGASTEHSPLNAYSVTLYRLEPIKRLKLLREVVSEKDGLRSVAQWGDTIFVIYPHLEASRVSVVHAADPMRIDDVYFNEHGFGVIDVGIAVTQPGLQTHLLIPLFVDASSPDHLKTVLARISRDADSQSGSGVQLGEEVWNEYVSLRREGVPGGPAMTPDLLGKIEGDKLALSLVGHSIAIDTLPPQLRGSKTKRIPIVVAVSQDYLVLKLQHTEKDLSGEMGDSTEIFVHKRLENSWNVINNEGNSSSSRLFGSWLCTTVGMWNPKHTPSPGRENEPTGASNGVDIQDMYSQLKGKWIWSPGVLLLQNLENGRTIRLVTGQEDSEILWVDNDSVIYRVNDEVYGAKLDRDKVVDAALLVKDNAISAVHWVFWAN